ncbi:MAG: division/cell wall cluster transcriptional repressor MraZ [candidate division Zixibacteria bacterium]|nr:division/cell wall cluster transcriptional repressor MraZ [candidate division Zixibacteria bacterium]MDD5426305.1 division/cell wall cluster transcriptional repressor MraZ [candidate division Zixibacteria bacterium]
MTGLIGRYQTTMDEKGRFALPAKLRAVVGPSQKNLLEGDLILTKGLEGCLSIYPENEWEEIQRRLSSLSFTQKDFRFFSRRFYSAAAVVTPDKNGRILIPSHLIKDARLKKDLLIIGLNRWIEIWNPDLFEYIMEQSAGSYEDTAERLLSGHEQTGP